MPEMKDKNEHRVPAWNGVRQMAPLNRWQQTGSRTDCETDHRDESGLKLFHRGCSCFAERETGHRDESGLKLFLCPTHIHIYRETGHRDESGLKLFLTSTKSSSPSETATAMKAD